MLKLRYSVPLERVVHITLTFTPWTTDKEACQEFSAITRQFLRLFPGGYVRILAFTKAGAPHLHVVAVADRDIRSGFDFEAYARMRTLNDGRSLSEEEKLERRRLGRQLTSNPDLKDLWAGLNLILERRRKKKGYQKTFAARAEVAPVIKNIEALGEYMIDNVEDTQTRPTVFKLFGRSDCTWIPGRLSPSVQIVRYGGRFPQALVYNRSKGQLHYERMLDAIFAGLRMPKRYMKDRFKHTASEEGDDGSTKRRRPNWHHYIREYALPKIISLYSEDVAKWPLDRVGEIAYSELQHIDQWARSGWPEVALEWRNAPGWKELGFRSHEEYVLSMISMAPPTVSMPVPPPGRKLRPGRTDDRSASRTAA